jgi:hypothetical protein
MQSTLRAIEKIFTQPWTKLPDHGVHAPANGCGCFQTVQHTTSTRSAKRRVLSSSLLSIGRFWLKHRNPEIIVLAKTKLCNYSEKKKVLVKVIIRSRSTKYCKLNQGHMKGNETSQGLENINNCTNLYTDSSPHDIQRLLTGNITGKIITGLNYALSHEDV